MLTPRPDPVVDVGNGYKAPQPFTSHMMSLTLTRSCILTAHPAVAPTVALGGEHDQGEYRIPSLRTPLASAGCVIQMGAQPGRARINRSRAGPSAGPYPQVALRFQRTAAVPWGT